MIAIVDYGIGNVKSIKNMLNRAGASAAISADPRVIESADKLILPGVGHFGYGIERLRASGLIPALERRALQARVPVLGICLGAQLMGRGSDEAELPGLGWLPMRTVAFDRARLPAGHKVPHMGWAETLESRGPLFAGMAEARFYFVHSFHFACDDEALVVSRAQHGYGFPAGVASGNLYAVQFHPEKSHAHGLRLLQNFAALGTP
ncbi:MAG TPA: imidazole glycerol phosphate synthase subunit HisH [Usitatibacter sp.]|nr:imidazole glycerol phosphate synthase subunit HisH [Usitatibacter sp.]